MRRESPPRLFMLTLGVALTALMAVAALATAPDRAADARRLVEQPASPPPAQMVRVRSDGRVAPFGIVCG